MARKALREAEMKHAIEILVRYIIAGVDHKRVAQTRWPRP